jgi:hypothetical protein
MGPYPFALAAALVAGLVGGAALGTIRLTRLSREWWGRMRERLRRAARGIDGGEDTDDGDALLEPGEPHGPPGAFPRAHGAIGAAALAAMFVLAAALVAEPLALPLRGLVGEAAGAWGRPSDLAAAFARGGPLGLLGFGLVALAITLAWALVAAALDRGVHGLSLYVARGASAEDLELSFADLRESALGLWDPKETRGDPFGVGLGYVALFASPVAALALVLTAPAGRLDTGGLTAFAAAFLVVPLAYAAAAERSQLAATAAQRRRAAMRQLATAPVWLVVLVTGTAGLGAQVAGGAGLAGATLALVLALPFALPGSSASPFALTIHRGGDRPEASPALRALTGLAHHAWMGAWAALVGGLVAPAGAGLALRVACALGALAALVLARALLALFLSPPAQRWALAAALVPAGFALCALLAPWMPR